MWEVTANTQRKTPSSMELPVLKRSRSLLQAQRLQAHRAEVVRAALVVHQGLPVLAAQKVLPAVPADRSLQAAHPPAQVQVALTPSLVLVTRTIPAER